MVLLQKAMITEGHDEERKAQETNLQRQWEERLKQEEILWRQKSMVKWLK